MKYERLAVAAAVVVVACGSSDSETQSGSTTASVAAAATGSTGAGATGGGGSGGSSSACAAQLVGTEHRLTNAAGLSSYPSIAPSGDAFALLWDDDRVSPTGAEFYGTRDIYFNRYDATAAPADADVAETMGDMDSFRPVLVQTDAGYAGVYAAADGVHFLTLGTDGALQSSALVASAPAGQSPPASFESPSLAKTSEGFGAAFFTMVNQINELYFLYLDGDGTPQGAVVQLSAGTGSSYPSLVWDGAGFGIAWQDRRDGSSTVYFRKLNKDGSPASSEVRITPTSVDTTQSISVAPKLVWTGSGYGVVYSDTRSGTYQVYLARIDASGKLLGETAVSTASDAGDTPTVAFLGEAYWVAWIQKPLAPISACAGSGFELKPTSVAIEAGTDVGLPYNGATPDVGACEFGGLADEGDVLIATVDTSGTASMPLKVTHDPGFTAFPVLGPKTGGAWVAWFDSRDQDREIYAAELACP